MVKKFLWTQFWIAGVSNALLNLFFGYLGNREMLPIGWWDAAVDVGMTCGFISLLVTLPTAWFTQKALKQGMPVQTTGRWLRWFPQNVFFLWLWLWLGATLGMEILTGIFYGLHGGAAVTFEVMLAWRFLWCGLLGGSLGVLVAARFLQR